MIRLMVNYLKLLDANEDDISLYNFKLYAVTFTSAVAKLMLSVECFKECVPLSSTRI